MIEFQVPSRLVIYEEIGFETVSPTVLYASLASRAR